ncbi:hypothetical protein PybrP1_002876 [[Pythium] brassicae (nom. inval.)]|nr:hypothetical protein PybrP1_002876 [[Pythium] brassicae (nom. inval.)]
MVGSSRAGGAAAAALSVSLSPLLPSSVEDDIAHSSSNGGGGLSANTKSKRVHFQPTHAVFTPRLTDSAALRYRKPDDRVTSLAPPSAVSSVAQPNYDDFLRRVSVVLYQHLRRCEKRHSEELRGPSVVSSTVGVDRGTSPFLSAVVSREGEPDALELPSAPLAPSTGPSSTTSPRLLELPVDEIFREEHFVTPQYKYTFVRLPRVFPMTSFVMEKVSSKRHVPSVDEIFRFCKNLFNKAQLSAECTIVCLIYIERLMEQANVPLLAVTWKPIVLCGLLLASKVWQDLSSWNVEISNIYPQYPLHSINRLERLFLHHIQWDLYISASVYAKYYFALRSLTEKKDFRRRYNYTMRVDPPNSRRLEERSAAVRHELYSKSL